jgi:hypothetical protein
VLNCCCWLLLYWMLVQVCNQQPCRCRCRRVVCTGVGGGVVRLCDCILLYWMVDQWMLGMFVSSRCMVPLPARFCCIFVRI